ncbi:MAG: ABC transporter permease [Oscillospiraceae bacterium]|nr:ABC transporter permease [Oscillospiraceae bacterium]MBQ5711119.1 ABC transporter permease [Oscillospiraceae bacterium]
MLKYIVKRLAYAILVLLGVSLIIYFLTRLMPIDFVKNKVVSVQTSGATVNQEMVDAMYEAYGLTENASFGEILKGYLNWLGDLVRFDLGTSFKYGIPVAEKIALHMGTSFIIALIATVFEFMIAIPLGITAATHQYSLRDYVVTILVMVGISLPSFFFGNILKNWLAYELGWFPPLGLTDATMDHSGFELVLDYGRHVFIPILTVVILSIGARMRMTRTNMLEVMNSDYIRTARAKGLKERVVINKHAFRNTLIPLVTSLAGLLPSLFSGAIITEQVFDLPGIGNIALQAMNAGDIPFIMGYNMFLAVLSVIGVLLADLMYALVDPRVKLE